MSQQYKHHGGAGRGSYGGPKPGDRVAPSGAGYGAGSGGRDSDDPKEILKGTDKASYRDSEDNIRPELLDRDARDEAEKRLSGISTTQLRRFFEQVGAIKRRIDLVAISSGEILAQAAFLKASAAYAAGRDRNNAPVLKFLVKHVNSIQTKQDFLDFHRHFEAVIAFHKVYGKQ